MFRSFGPVEILLILGVVLLVFGASRLPQMGLSLGKGLREFKRGITTGSDFNKEGTILKWSDFYVKTIKTQGSPKKD
mgnify:CR=1 FL=1